MGQMGKGQGEQVLGLCVFTMLKVTFSVQTGRCPQEYKKLRKEKPET